MSTEDDSVKIRECVNTMLNDTYYRNCILQSGLIVPKVNSITSFASLLDVGLLRTPPVTAALELSPDLVQIQCSADPSSPSIGCCHAVSEALNCEASNNPKAKGCKVFMDEVIWKTFDCPQVHSADVVGIILALFLAASLFGVRYVARSSRSTVWVRQLWGLLVKNWRIAKHRWGRQFKGVFIALILFGIVIVLLKLTGETTVTYSVRIPNSQLSWPFSFTGPDDRRTTILQNLRVVAGLLFIIAFTYPLAQVVLCIVQEKELMIREAMKVTGLYDSVLQASWCLSYLVQFLPLCVITAIVTHFGLIFPNFRVSSLIMFFASFCAAMVSFCLAISVFFDNTRPAVIFILVFTFVLSFLIYLMPDSRPQQGFMCLIAPACLGLGISNALGNTSYGSGFRMAYLNLKNEANIMPLDGMTFIMFLDAVVYAMIAWYLEKILPKRVGIRYPWHFPFHKSFWLGQPSRPAEPLLNKDMNSMEESDAVVEPIDRDLTELLKANQCVHVMDLSRKFKTPGLKERKSALDNLNLTLFEGQITSLLGHNGAGKTTLMRILCGLMEPTSGDAKVFGHSIRHDMPTIRRSLGMCPQYDILFDDMTCYENLWLFAALKGVPFKGMKQTIMASLAELGMGDKINQKVETLSGGQKRKLCVAIAFIGNSRVVFLDEPTSGMDPYSRRFTWEVLLKNRKGRVIVLTTHFMDEAEVLGDRVAIMNDGRLCCYGTSLFLKNKFGNGYTITLTLKKFLADSQTILDRVHQLFTEIMPEAKLISQSTSQFSFQMPLYRISEFPHLFRNLEKFGDSLEFGISNCTLEDVFITVAQKREDSGSDILLSSMDHLQNIKLIIDSNDQFRDESRDSSYLVANEDQRQISEKKEGIFGVVLRTMVLKRWWLAKRDRRQFLLLVLLPIIFLFLPTLLPEIKIVDFVEKGPYVHPVPGPSTCNATDAFNPIRSCSMDDLSDCVDENGIQILPQHLSYAWMRTTQRCRGYSGGWDFCKYIPFICDPDSCCDFTDYRSLMHPCQLHTSLKRGTNLPQANIFCPTSTIASIEGAVNAFIKSLAVLLAFLFCPSMVIAHAVMETESHHNTKFQQLVSGVRKVTYWAGAAIWDFSTISVTISAACVIIMYYDGPLSSYSDAYFVIVALLISYGVAMIPFVYLLSFRFSSAPHALAMLLVFNIATGAGLGIIAYLMKAFAVPIPGSLTLTSFDIYSYSRYIFLILPAFNLIDGLLRLQTNTIEVCIQRYSSAQCESAGTMRNGFYLLFLNFVYLGLLSVLCFAFVAWKETQPKAANEESTRSKVHRRLKKHWEAALSLFSPSNRTRVDDEDIDVRRERERIQNDNRPSHDPLEIRGLSKTYSNSKVALHELWLGVQAGECFGYLGVNGAGKTTTLKCMTGFQRPSSGTAKIAGYDIIEDVYSARKHAGYCPQFDALFDLLTVEEHLNMYCRIRRIPLSSVPLMIESMQLNLYKQVPSGFLSGGNRRKLAAAIAMIGRPRVIFLDEPSTGMDPHAKRFLWRVIMNTVKITQAALVLTTHSMEECEALCSRVAILIDGRLKCIGTIQHLKSKFGRGYTVEIRSTAPTSTEVDQLLDVINESRITSANLQAVCERLGNICRKDKFLSIPFLGGRLLNDLIIPLKDFAKWWLEEEICTSIDNVLKEKWPNVIVKGKHGQHMIFEIPESRLLLSDLFERLESISNIDYYSVSQTPLEEIFNSFAKEQTALQSP